MLCKKTAIAGFTLVELAIVMVIIGLLIGGILQGNELIRNARVNRTISDSTGFVAAIYAYKDKYNALPGDHRNALTQLAGCTTASFCANGDGNIVIAAPDYGTDIYIARSILGTSGVAMEATQLWKHLALADLVTGVNPNADPANPAWGDTHPAASIGGGYEIYYDAQTNVAGNVTILRISKHGIVAGPWENLATPKIAAMIDRKMDDGMPNTGKTIANYGQTTDECKISEGSAVIYNETLDTTACTIYTILFR